MLLKKINLKKYTFILSVLEQASCNIQKLSGEAEVEQESEMKKTAAFLKEHKLYILLLIILIAYVGRINSGYVYQDAFEVLGEYNTYITIDTPLRQEIIPSGRNFCSILLNIAAPEEPDGQYITTIRIYADEKELFVNSFTNDTSHEVDDMRGYATEFVFDDIINVDKNIHYYLEITSDAPVQANAYGFGQNAEGSVWNRPAYLLFTEKQRKITVFLSVFILSMLVYILFFRKKAGARPAGPENIFAVLSIPLCLLYLVLVPIFQVPDEVNHYVRTYGILHGCFLVPADGQIPVPENLIPFPWYSYTPYILFKNFIMQIDGSKTILHDNVNMALYSPVSYIFQVFGVGLGEVLTHNTYIMAALGSIANAAGCTVILYYAIKYIPYGKGIVLFLALTPMSLQERASLSVDAITFSMAVAMLAYCLYMRANRKQMSKRQLLLLYLIMFMTASCKVVYFIVAALVFIIPWECFGSKKKSVFHKCAGLAMVFLVSFGWLLIAGRYLQYTRGGGETAEKAAYILKNPGRYLYIMDKMIWQDGVNFLDQMIGSNLGSLDIIINSCLIVMLLVLLCRFLFWERDQSRLPDHFSSLIMAGIGTGTIFLIFTSLYIQWTELAASTYEIQGLQGRYFLPVLPYLLCAYISNNNSNEMLYEGNKVFLKSAYALFFLNLLVLVMVWDYSAFS